MIRYTLRCESGHAFDAWFRSSRAYDGQARRAQVVCPECGSSRVEKALMTPSVATGAKRETAPRETPAESPSTELTAAEARAMARKLRDYVLKHSDDVGPRFAEEARKIHYKEAEPRGIHGQATGDEAQALHDEGIEFHPLPILPEDQN